jgi:hypothetical protein
MVTRVAQQSGKSQTLPDPARNDEPANRGNRKKIDRNDATGEEAAGPTEQERAILQEAQAAYDANPSAGSSWREVEARLRKQT